jgi:histone deacetylase 8
VDLDLHHGDGVEKAFYYSDNVFTLSIHRHGAGFFPGTGAAADRGKGRGKGHCLNLPLEESRNGEDWFKVFACAFDTIVRDYDPRLIVVVCGADVLATDPHKAMNVGTKWFTEAVSRVVSSERQTVVLGGGYIKAKVPGEALIF